MKSLLPIIIASVVAVSAPVQFHTEVVEYKHGETVLEGYLTYDNSIKAKVLVLHGSDDPIVPAEQVAAFQEEMRKGDVDWQMVIYGGAVHSFTNPESGNKPSRVVAYNETADKRSWEAMKLFFEEIFK